MPEGTLSIFSQKFMGRTPLFVWQSTFFRHKLQLRAPAERGLSRRKAVFQAVVMKTKKLFRGAATALITPFTRQGIDTKALEKLLEFQLSSGISAIVVCGTTGEASTLSFEEWKSVVTLAVNFTKGRVPVIAGCGSNCTTIAENKAAEAEKAGASGVLCVTPYYNKATPEGLVRHFKRVARSTALPVILYNVPSRTGVDIPMDVYGELSHTKNIVGIKEASGDAAKSAELISRFKDRFSVYSGSDEINLPILSLGGDGVISVLSNIVPERVVELCNSAFAENYRRAALLSHELYPLTKALFCEVNPVPIKTALAEIGFCKPYFRLPLCEMGKGNKELLLCELKKLGIL